MRSKEKHISPPSSKVSHDSSGLDDEPKPKKPNIPPSDWAKEILPEARPRKPLPPYAWYSRRTLEKLKKCSKVANLSRAITVFLALIHHDEKGHGRTDHSFGFMATFLGISRNTFRAGIVDLEVAGIIHVCHRKGNYPAKDKPPIVTILPIRMHSKVEALKGSNSDTVCVQNTGVSTLSTTQGRILKEPPATGEAPLKDPEKETSNPALQSGPLAPNGTRPDAAVVAGKEKRRPKLPSVFRQNQGA